MDIGQIVIVALIFVGIFSYDFFKYKVKMKQLEARLNEAEKVKLFDEMQSVKHRLVVLEKIITDKGYEVREEIEKLNCS